MDPNSEADKSLTPTGQKTVGNLATTGQKMEMYRKPLEERNLIDVIFSNRKTHRRKRDVEEIISEEKKTFVS